MNDNLPRCAICGQIIRYDKRLTIKIETYHKVDNYTNSTSPKIIKKYNYHKSCYQMTHPKHFEKIEELL